MAFKVLTIVGTRPELIKLSKIIPELDKAVDHILVHTGQNHAYELCEIFFNDLGIRKPDYFLNAVGSSAVNTIGAILKKTDVVMKQEKPDALLLLGDTNSCLCAIVAKKRRIPIFHMEAGNRCFDERVPEEINRKIIDHISDINLPYTDHAQKYLLAEGLKPQTVIKTGSPMKEVLDFHMPKILESKILTDLKLNKDGYFVVSIHREENVDSSKSLSLLLKSFEQIVTHYKKPIIVSTHPRTAKQLKKQPKKINSLVRFESPFGFFDYVRLQKDAFCVLSDSGSLTEEASILNFPAVMLREAHERPEGMDEASVMMGGLSEQRIINAIDLTIRHYQSKDRCFRIPSDYDVDNVSKKVVRIILSYTDYVNRFVWHKNI